ncbi:hypothetical protein MTR_7g069535 [Medicago truncatula]|uniref:Uncharacterized protein n=1 Tax=Medicago truncatula TaxID=3880 RepID=A0A072U0L6_MEDTR|nr:hypothetical protein MTR_7g069535 [Medicago truncatula]
MVSEPLQDPLGHLLSGFRYWATHHLCPRTKPNSVGREGMSSEILSSIGHGIFKEKKKKNNFIEEDDPVLDEEQHFVETSLRILVFGSGTN